MKAAPVPQQSAGTGCYVVGHSRRAATVRCGAPLSLQQPAHRPGSAMGSFGRLPLRACSQPGVLRLVHGRGRHHILSASGEQEIRVQDQSRSSGSVSESASSSGNGVSYGFSPVNGSALAASVNMNGTMALHPSASLASPQHGSDALKSEGLPHRWKVVILMAVGCVPWLRH